MRSTRNRHTISDDTINKAPLSFQNEFLQINLRTGNCLATVNCSHFSNKTFKHKIIKKTNHLKSKVSK